MVVAGVSDRVSRNLKSSTTYTLSSSIYVHVHRWSSHCFIAFCLMVVVSVLSPTHGDCERDFVAACVLCCHLPALPLFRKATVLLQKVSAETTKNEAARPIPALFFILGRSIRRLYRDSSNPFLFMVLQYVLLVVWRAPILHEAAGVGPETVLCSVVFPIRHTLMQVGAGWLLYVMHLTCCW